MKNLIECKALELGYKTARGNKKVVGPVSFAIAEGESAALVGESGSGKSTLGFAILGLLSARGGLVLSGDLERALRPEEIAFIPQDPLSALDPLFSVGSQMRETGADREQIEEVLNRVHLPLEHFSLKSYPHELSGGMRQRVVIAMALLRKPRLMIADEPTSSLDMTLQASVMSLFSEINRGGVTFLFISHHLPLAVSVCGRLMVMKDGDLVEIGSPAQIMNSPKHDYTRMLVDSIPELKL